MRYDEVAGVFMRREQHEVFRSSCNLAILQGCTLLECFQDVLKNQIQSKPNEVVHEYHIKFD